VEPARHERGVSKYFRGPLGSPQRETSVRQVIGRVADTFGRWGLENGYFASPEDAQAFRDELVYLLLHQYGSFNSPVWFNIGVSGAKQQASACFINSVHDNMESIMELAATEARLFQRRLGAGSNLSRIRSSKEHLSGGGIASGPVSFMRGWDAFAGAIKSGGTTRRAAKMVILDAQHPDIEEFILCKATEEKKAWALIDAGYNGGFNVPGGAYDSVDFQNANHSVRVTDEFMRAAENGMEWSTRSVTDDSPCGKHKRQGLAAQNRRSDAHLRRPRPAIRHHHQRLAHQLPIRIASMPATRARSSSSSTTPPATWPA
jgi:ribonucleoside-diphosphate reductase alpha chain